MNTNDIVPKDIQEIAQKIGQFFLKKNNNDYKATEKEIVALRINRMEFNNGRLTIELSRPGLIIGRKCILLENLVKYIGCPIDIVETRQSLLDFLVPYDYSDY